MDEKIKIQHKFDDFAECTEYYYDELGKLEALKDEGKALTKKEAKKMHEYIIFSFFTAMDNLKSKVKAVDNVEKTEIKEFNKDYNSEHKTSILVKIAMPFKAIGRASKAIFKSIGRVSKAEVLAIPKAETKALKADCDKETPKIEQIPSSPVFIEVEECQENPQNEKNLDGEETMQNE